MSQIALDTTIDELEMHQRLHNRLTLCRVKTFEGVMKINPRDWADVNPKVVNALKRFQSAHATVYRRLSGSDAPESVDYTKERRAKRRAAATDERRFFVANNLLSAYAQGGLLFHDGSVIGNVMEEIMTATDAFLDAYYKSDKNEASSKPDDFTAPMAEEPDDDDTVPSDLGEEEFAEEYAGLTDDGVEADALPAGAEPVEVTALPEAAEPEDASYLPASVIAANHPVVEGGEYITLTDYHGQRPSTSRLFKVGDTLLVKAMKSGPNGRVAVKAIVGNKLVQFDSDHYDWEATQNDTQQPHGLHHLFSEI